MLVSFLSQERADLGEVVKSLAQQMSWPTMSPLEHLKRFARNLLGLHSVAVMLEQQRLPENVSVSVHSDKAADRATRRSTAGVGQRLVGI